MGTQRPQETTPSHMTKKEENTGGRQAFGKNHERQFCVARGMMHTKVSSGILFSQCQDSDCCTVEGPTKNLAKMSAIQSINWNAWQKDDNSSDLPVGSTALKSHV